MLFKSALVTQASGSMGGLTASRNKGGMYTRARAIPTNPGTAQQGLVRGYLAQLTALWGTTLTDAQRAAWQNYALNTPVLNKLGDAKIIPALAHYVRSNVPRLQAGLARVDDAPTTFGLGDFTMPGITSITASTRIAIVTFDNTDDWAGETGAAMIFHGSRGQSESINYFKGPFQYAAKLAGAGTPLTSPQNILLPFALAAGQKAWVAVRVSRADGRLSGQALLYKTCI